MTVSTSKIVLASRSPRRRELLSDLGFEFEVHVPELNEDPLAGESAIEHILRLSLAKAMLIAGYRRADLVIGADTIVVLDNKILGKPSSPEHAVKMLKLLSGKPHTVYTGLSLVILDENIIRSDYDATRVIFNDLEPAAIIKYVESGEPLDKAGSYGIQGMGSFLVNHYEGEFDTVIGFPTKLFKRMFEEVASCRNR
jgi:septum formation protein